MSFRRRPLLFLFSLAVLLIPSTAAHATSAGFSARMVEDVNSIQTEFFPSGFTQLGSSVLFSAGIYDGYVSSESVWQTSGTASGTSQFHVPGNAKGFPSNFTVLGNRDLFVESYASTGPELWVTNGIKPGTSMVKAFHNADDLFSFLVNGSTMYFIEVVNYQDYYLWKTDGTPNGTSLVRRLPEQVAYYGGDHSFDNIFLAGQSFGDKFNAVARTIYGGGGGGYGYGSTPPKLVLAGGRIYVFAAAKNTGNELWTSDGSSAGTKLLKDINSGTDGSSPSELTTVGNELYFTADDGVHGRQLWKTSGTAAGTVMVRFVLHSNPRNLVANGSHLLFVATKACLAYSGVCHSPALGEGLWATNGTTGGTYEIHHLSSAAHEQIGSLTYLSTSSGTSTSLFTITYLRRDGTIKRPGHRPKPRFARVQQLWRTSGTASSTKLVKIIDPGFNSSIGGFTPFTANGATTAIFSANSAASGQELWRTTGTPAGTVMIRDINPGKGSSRPFGITAVTLGSSPAVLFAANDGSHGAQLWRSDGTSAHTMQVGTVNSSTASSNPSQFIKLGHGMDFVALGPKSPGSSQSTVNVYRTFGGSKNTTELGPFHGYFGFYGGYPSGVVLGNEEIYVCAQRQHSVDLCRMGTSPSTTGILRHLVLPKGEDGYYRYQLTVAGNHAFLMGGREVWVTDGDPRGTELIHHFPSDLSDNGRTMTSSGNTLFFTVYAEHKANQIWKSDGTSQGTVQVAAPRLTNPKGYVSYLARVNNKLFIAANQSGSTTVWVGDADGSNLHVMLKLNDKGRDKGSVAQIHPDGPYFLMSVYDPHKGWLLLSTLASLYKPSVLLTGNVDTIVEQSPCGSTCPHLRHFYVSAYGSNTGHVLYLTDGTRAGTLRLTALRSIYSMTVVDSRLYFIAADGFHGNELWSSNGTPAATKMVKDIRIGVGGSGIEYMTPFKTGVLFDANDHKTGNELWWSDGSTAGTRQVDDLMPGPDSSSPYTFTMFDGSMFFIAETKANGYSLWSTDGTKGNMHLVRSLLGFNRYSITQPIVVGNLLYFDSLDSHHGTELWAAYPAS